MNTRIARFIFFAFALIAVSALVFEPICEAAQRQVHSASHAAGGSGDGDACCSILSPAALHTAASLADASSSSVVALNVGVPVFRLRVAISNALPAAQPVLVPSFYIRSARIQR